ncbi:MAG: hypothetical protein AUG75_03595 [Cyanobacteria bacterium 13_1_20CM_4_61_6]|nr:MAG: hypothetical protein AUG75_03595 [Cyanobacteria bacterium 13_1_20CM_4_61_6]
MVKRLRVFGFGSGVPIAGLALCLTAVVPTSLAAANEVAQWNETTMKAIVANGQNNVVSTRTLAMVQVAVHDALNAISRRYDAYYFEGPAEPAASPDAAIAAATHTVLVGVIGLYGTPAQKGETLALVDQAYAASIGRVTDGPARNKGVAANPPIANADLARGYLPTANPGWGNVTPFTLLSSSQFWLPGPPALTSETYARDYNEVKSVGGKVSTVRTADQTQIARFWVEGPGNWNTIARTVATARGLDARDSARVLALMNMAMADAYIAGFKIRYVYDLWRPVTAIREGDNDGNDATVGDATWDSHQNTPSVSDYPSTQSTFSAAAAVALASALGGDQASFTVTSGKPFEGITRSFTSFSQAARESADSRVYAGIHFRSACEDGLSLGRKVGERVAKIYLQPVKK